MPSTHRVVATSLNLRSEPVVEARTRIAVLPQGALVERLGDAEKTGWWRVRAIVDGVSVVGVVASAHLVPADTGTLPSATGGLVPVHLETNHPVRRNATSGRAHRLNEPDQPRRVGGDAAALGAIIAWLRVEQSARHRPANGATFCNIYAYDYACLAGVYLPRVWWTPSAATRLLAGEQVPVAYDETVRELNANGLCNWFEDVGTTFGWRRTFGLDALQQHANAGGVGIIVARRVDLNRSGHITAVVPETTTHRARRTNGTVVVPLQSQAGSTNFRYGAAAAWWTQAKFARHGFWLHD